MAQEFHPKIDVIATPKKLQQGQMLAVQAYIFDTITGMDMPFDKIYMQIVDSKGVEIWPMSTIAEGVERIDKLISTSQMKPGKYLIRISPSKKLSPMGSVEFQIERSLSQAIIPLIPAVILAVTSSTKQEKIESEFLAPKSPKITWLIYQTEKDHRVCPICAPNDGLVFRPDDPTLIRIGPPELGGDTHYGCRCHYDFITQEMEMRQLNAQWEELEEVHEAYEVAMIAQQVFNQKRLN